MNSRLLTKRLLRLLPAAVVLALVTLTGCRNARSEIKSAHDAAAAGDIDRLESLLDANPGLRDAPSERMERRLVLHVASQEGRTDVVRMLLKRGANPNVRDASPVAYTPLHLAAERGHRRIVDALLTHGADADATTSMGEAALTVAARAGRGDVIEVLLQRGAKVDGAPQPCVTPLQAASAEGHVEIVRLLLRAGADVNIGSKDGNSALIGALLHGHASIAGMLLSKGAERDIFSATALGDNAYVAERLNESPKLVHAQLPYGANSLLHIAAKCGKRDTAYLLIKHGVNVNRRCGGDAPLHVAARFGKVSVIEVLLQGHAAINAKDPEGNTPLHWAAEKNHLGAVQCLLRNGANVAAVDNNLSTPLHHAIRYECSLEIIRSLLVYGAKADAADRHGMTPVMLGRHKQNGKAYLSLLSEFGAKE